jgi:MoaA/NifB/PqqE/SkfB family radical SAM enzyme
MIATTLHQIEVTSQCNLRCVYCLHPTLTRATQHMTTHTWLQCLRWLQHFVTLGTQAELVLSGTGEPTLNPRLAEWALEARQILGPHRRLMTTTNGLAMTRELAQSLKPSQIRVYVSLHRPEKAEQAVYWLQEAGLFEQAVMDPVMGPNNWAGQVDWPDRINRGGNARPVCPWLSRGWLFVSSEGDFYACCYANGGTPKLGHVDEPCRTVRPEPWAICHACWQRPPRFNELSPEVVR